MLTLPHYSLNHKHELFLKRKRIVRVREIIDNLGSHKHTATPQLIIEALNRSGDENVCLADASDILQHVLHLTSTKSPYSALSRLTAYYWQSNRLHRFKYVVLKLGGVDAAKPDEILEAMRINDDNDYYLTIDDVKRKLNVYRKYLEHPYLGFMEAGHRLDSMWPAPLVTGSDDLSRKFDKLFLDENNSGVQVGGSGGAIRRRRGKDNNSNSCYKKKIDHVVTDLRRLNMDLDPLPR